MAYFPDDTNKNELFSLIPQKDGKYSLNIYPSVHKDRGHVSAKALRLIFVLFQKIVFGGSIHRKGAISLHLRSPLSCNGKLEVAFVGDILVDPSQLKELTMCIRYLDKHNLAMVVWF